MGFGKAREGITPKYDTQALADAARRRRSIEVPPPMPPAILAPSKKLPASVNSVAVQSLRPTAILIFDITTFRALFRHVTSSFPENRGSTTSDPWSTRGWLSIPATFTCRNGGHSQSISSVRGLLEPPNGPHKSERILAQQQLQDLNPRQTSNQVLSAFLRDALNTLKAKASLTGLEFEYMFVLPSHWSQREISAYNAAIISAEIKNKRLCPEMYARAWYVARNLTFPSRKWCVLIIPQDGITIQMCANDN